MKSKLALVLLATLIGTGNAIAQEEHPTPEQATKQHEFLKQFTGEWECEIEAYMSPEAEPTKASGSMTGHMIGDFWAIVNVKCDMMGFPYHGQGTFGFDSKQDQYVGNWIDSMSEFVWKYEGTVDGNKLILDSEGPSPADPTKMVKARDTWEFKNSDLMVLTGQMEGPDGKMITMMTATCKRKK